MLALIAPHGHVIRQRALVMGLTERVVEAYYDARGYQIPPYAYVLHDRQTKDG